MRPKKPPAKRSVEKQALSALAHTIANQHEADRQQEAREDRGKRYREYATIALLVLTTAGLFVQAVVFYRQLGEMQKVYAPIAEQAKATRESYASVQRAFISNVRLELRPESNSDGKPGYWTVHLTVQNSGATPTKNLEYVSGYFRAPAQIGDPEELFSLPAEWLKITKGALTIAPQSDVEIQNPAIFGLASANNDPRYNMISGFLAGAIRYHDQFIGSEIHITKFCFQILDNSKLLSFPCSRWNCSDDDCETNKEQYDSGIGALIEKQLGAKPGEPSEKR